MHSESVYIEGSLYREIHLHIKLVEQVLSHLLIYVLINALEIKHNVFDFFMS